MSLLGHPFEDYVRVPDGEAHAASPYPAKDPVKDPAKDDAQAGARGLSWLARSSMQSKLNAAVLGNTNVLALEAGALLISDF